MRLLSCSLIILALAACAGPTPQAERDPAPVRESDQHQAGTSAQTADSVDPVEPVPVIEVREQPAPEAEPPAVAVEAPVQYEPAVEADQPTSIADTPAEPPAAAEPVPEPVAAPAAAAEPSSAAVNLSGRVTILVNGREQPFAGLHLNQTVIAWRPAGPALAEAMTEQQIMTRRSRFFPQTMAVTSGTSVRFPNMDSIRHNVFSLSPGHQFDVGLYSEGDGRSQTFTGSGMVELYCNVHPNMAAFMLVLDTPYFINPDEEGQFTLRDLPAGPGELLIWNYRAEDIFQRMPMRLSAVSEPLNIRLDITRPAVPQHTNKHGETYNRDRARP